MKNSFMKVISLVLFLGLVISLSGCDRADRVADDQRFPWQVKHLPGNQTQVFGIKPGVSSFEEFVNRFGTHFDDVVFEDKNHKLDLEIYFNEISIAGLSGKFILTLDADEELKIKLIKGAFKHKLLESGVLRHDVHPHDKPLLSPLTIHALTYIPYVDLDEKIIKSRFGEAARVIKIAEGKVHYLFPEMGLDLFQDDDGKEVLLYVAPKNFSDLEKVLLEHYPNSSNGT